MEQWIFIAFLIAVPVLYGANEAWNVWRDLRPDKMRAVFILGDKQIRSMRVTINSNGKTFDVSQGKGKRAHKYVIAESAVFHSGRFRIPTSYYNWGRIEPINLKSLTSETEISSEDFHEGVESNIGSQIIREFQETFLTPQMSLMIILAVLAIGLGFVYVQLNSQLEVIIEGLELNVEPTK